MKKKTLFIGFIISIALAAIVVLTVFFVHKNNTEKTYTNDMLGISFVYPKEFGNVEVHHQFGQGAEFFRLSFTEETQLRASIQSIWKQEDTGIRRVVEEIKYKYREPHHAQSLSPLTTQKGLTGIRVIGQPDAEQGFLKDPQMVFALDHPFENYFLGMTWILSDTTQIQPETVDSVLDTLEIYEPDYVVPIVELNIPKG